MDQNVASALCYIAIIGLIFLLIEPYNKNKTVRFHALQSLFYAGAWFVIGILMIFVRVVLAFILPWGLQGIISLFSMLVYLGLFVLLIFMAVKAYQGQKFVLPVLGPLAEKNA
jgi:uncharacterized membrane protein